MFMPPPGGFRLEICTLQYSVDSGEWAAMAADIESEHNDRIAVTSDGSPFDWRVTRGGRVLDGEGRKGYVRLNRVPAHRYPKVHGVPHL